MGLQPRRTRAIVDDELAVWAARGVRGHFDHPLGHAWVSAAEALSVPMAAVVGALPSEVAVMGSLTANLHVLLASFYRPAGARTKILMEAKAFPSDQYAAAAQIAWHGLDAAAELVEIAPRAGAHALTTADVVRALDRHRDDAALLLLGGVQYYTGQAFDVKLLTAHAQSRGITVGWDLAHAAGNIPLELHEWGVDFAAWCSYKYLSAGPGGIAGIFVHDKHNAAQHPRLAGWWGNAPDTRFDMGSSESPSSVCAALARG